MPNLVPIVVERTGQNERSYDIFSRLLKDRIIMLDSEISNYNASLVVAQMLFLEAEDPAKDILCYINTPGGSVTAGMSIYDTMQYIKSDVSTIVMGQAASMGSLLAMAGTKGKRFILPNARHMCHQPSGGTQGMASDIEITFNELKRWKKVLVDIYAMHTGKDLATLEKDMDRDTFMSAEEAVAYGLADSIMYRRP